MPQTKFFLDQSIHTPGSGSFVSDAELRDFVVGASGFIIESIEEIVHVIPARGDETDSKPRTLFDIPVNEYDKSGDTSTWWSVRVPFGVRASGITFATAWFIPTSGTGQNVKFEVDVKPLEVGVDLSAVAPVSTIETESADVGPYVAQSTSITIPISPYRPFFSFRFTRKASLDTYPGSVYTVAHGIKFLVDDTGD